MDSTASVQLEFDGPCAYVTLHDPKRMNAMSRAMWRALREAFERLATHAEVRVVQISGHGGHFCAGGNIAEYPDFRFDHAALQEFHEHDVWGALNAMLSCDVPLVARIKGNCMGAGVEIACCADIRLAADHAQFGAPIARLGFPMAPRETALVLREAGAVVTRAMLLEAAVFSAPELLARGFLTRVVAEEDLDAVAAATLARLAAGAPQAARLNKQTIRQIFESRTRPEDKSKAITSIACAMTAPALDPAYAYADSAEHREGIAAFLAKRKPVF